jgi:nitrogen fixation/metabolism regulation signal transduction histidine kinase
VSRLRLGLQGKTLVGLLLVALVPLVVALVLVDQLAATAGRVSAGEARRLREPLVRAGDAFKELVAARKEAFSASAGLMATGPEVAAACRGQGAEATVQALLAAQPRALRIAVTREGTELAAAERKASGKSHDFDVDAAVPGSAPPCLLRVRWGFPDSILDGQQVVGAALHDRRYLEEVGRALPRYYFIGFAILFGSVVSVVTVLAILVARRFTRRLKRLAAATHEVAAGDLTARAALSGTDELGDLGREFDLMVGELAASRTEIEYLQKIAAWQEVARRLAHEIKNPLTPIQLAVQQLASSYASGATGERFQQQLAASVEIVEEEVGGLRRLVDAFSSFAKLPPVEAAPVDLAVIVDDVVQSQPGLELEVVAPAGQITVQGDRLLLRRALTNLVDNAREAGARRARIAWQVRGRTAELTVDDDGPGIGPELQRRVFDPYVTTKEHGTGLGLAIVKKSLLEHGGDVRVEAGPSPLGGARFVVTVPLAA